MNYTVTIDGVLHFESECDRCQGKGAYEVMIPGTQGYDRYAEPRWEWHKCYDCNGSGVVYAEIREDD